MKLAVEEISAVEKKLTVTIDKKEVSKEYERIVSDVRRNATIKGFRKGKAPKNVIESSYGAKINEDLVTKLIDSSFQNALKEKELMPVAQPSIKMESFNKNEDFVYSMTVELMPEFELNEYTGFDLDGKATTVNDNDVDDALVNLREHHAVFNETDDSKKVESGDMVIFDFKGYTSDGNMIKDGHQENFSVAVGSGNLVPGFEDNLIGLKKSEEKEFTVTFPESYFEKEYAGADIKFEIKVNEIKEKELPALDDEFAKNFGDYKTLDELKVFVRGQLEEEKKKGRELFIREQIVDKLIDLNKFDVPKSLVERQLDYIVQEAKQRMQRQGADITKVSDLEARENSREMAIKMVKRDLILGRIVEKEKFKVEAAEIEAKYDDMAKSIGQPVQVIKDYYKKVNAEQALRDDILIQKVFNKIADTANIQEA
jgi:trigger factor